MKVVESLKISSERDPISKRSLHTAEVASPNPAVANGVVYVGSDDHNLYALNATAGDKLWSYTTFDNAPSLLATTREIPLNKPAQRV